MPSQPFVVVKVDEAECLVFGYGSVSMAADGTLLTDIQGDQIPIQYLEPAVYDFVQESGETDEMHQGPVKGRLVESFVITPDKLEKMGLPRDAIPPRWWLGFKYDPDAFAKVRSGQYQFFSIEGHCDPLEVPA